MCESFNFFFHECLANRNDFVRSFMEIECTSSTRNALKPKCVAVYLYIRELFLAEMLSNIPFCGFNFA